MNKEQRTRMGAVQALHQLNFNPNHATDSVTRFAKENHSGLKLGSLDKALLTHIVKGAEKNADDISHMIHGLMPENWQFERLDSVMQAILKCAAFELVYDEAYNTSPVTIIATYTDIAHSFFDKKAGGMVNAILDSLRKEMEKDVFE